MKYAILIYHNEELNQSMTPEEGQALMAAYYAFGAGLTANGVEHSGEALLPVATATTVRVREGQTLTTDGPFAETKEQLGGFYIVDAENLDDAIAIAAKVPDAKSGSIEVRPVMVFD